MKNSDMTLPRALLGSVATHLLLLGLAAQLYPEAALGGDASWATEGRWIELEFVERVGLDAAVPLSDRTASVDSEAPVEHSFAEPGAAATGGGESAAGSGGGAAGSGSGALGETGDAEAAGGSAEEDGGPRLDSILRYRLFRSILSGRDVFDVYRAAYEPGERNSITYRDFFRAFADAYLAAYEDLRAVRAELQQNLHIRDLARFDVRFDRDGTFSVTGFELLPGVVDPDGSIRAHYEGILGSMSSQPFVSPLEAGLPTPYTDNFLLLNDAHLRHRKRGGS